MPDKNLYSIGELSRLCNVTDRTLRYYDKINLLKPTYIDPDNNYRYYSTKDILTINIVKKMKYNGFKLEDVKKIIRNNDIRTLEDIYTQKKIEMNAQIEHLQQMKMRIDKRLQVFRDIFCEYLENIKDGKKSKQDDFEIRFIEKPAKKIAYSKFNDKINLENLLMRCNNFMDMIYKYNLDVEEPYMAIYHGDYSNMDANVEDTEVELCAYLKSADDTKCKYIRELPEGTYACTIVKGAFENTKKTAMKMKKWLEKNSFVITGPILRVYMFGIEHARSADNYITDLQIPVAKK